MRPSNPEHLGRVLERLSLILEEELGEDVSAWIATVMVLLQMIADSAEVDMKEIIEVLTKSHKAGHYPFIQ
jgi:hypothetical protein